jgi:hypothetical protein
MNRLHEMKDRPCAEYGRQAKPISKNQIARLLKPYGIRPGTKRDGNETFKGYERSQFDDVFARYLPTENVTPPQPL